MKPLSVLFCVFRSCLTNAIIVIFRLLIYGQKSTGIAPHGADTGDILFNPKVYSPLHFSDIPPDYR